MGSKPHGGGPAGPREHIKGGGRLQKTERCSGLPLAKYTARVAARLQKADRVPLALGRFSRRGAVPACENRSAAPNTAPCFIHRMRSLCLPLLRFGCFCRRQRLAQLQTPTKMHGARPPVRRNVSAARVARYPVKPLALSRFLRRAAAGACKNRSAAPAAAPCFVHWTRSPPLPFAHFSSRKVGALTTGRRESILVLNP